MDVAANRTQWVGAARRSLLAIAALVAASPAALANPTTLICNAKGTEGVYSYDGAIVVDLDETQRSITVHYPGTTGTVPVFHREPHSFGPMPATFNADNITFSIPGNVITINRLTGDAVLRTLSGQVMAESWNCHVGKKQF
jgi:hypothetical protein